MTAAATTAVKVRALRAEAQDVVSLELCAADGSALAPQSPGAHLDVHLPNGLVRSYSLCGSLASEGERGSYRIAVGRSAASRGGSSYVHEHVRVGDTLRIGAPRNHFRLDEGALQVVLIAGGIGITPLLAMARQCARERRDWRLHYCVRTGARAAFIDELRALEGGQDRVTVWCSADGTRFDATSVLRPPLPSQSQVYCCGSPSLMNSVEQAISWLPEHHRHFERFAGSDSPLPGTGAERSFTVHLDRSQKTLEVPAGRSLLECLESIGMSVPFACREGLCGSCETPVLGGCVEHRDFVLAAADRALHQRMMVCVSRAADRHLTLDL